MRAARRRGLQHGGVIVTIAFLIAAGCSHSPSADEATDKALKDAGLSKTATYKLAGKVTIDQRPPQLAQGQRFFVMLNDPAKPNETWEQKPFAEINGEGDFTFGSYKKADGIKAGKYVLTFAILKKKGKRGFAGPDQLKNLYNDPDKNAKDFTIDHQAPGKTDYAFNLEMAGKPEGQVGPRSFTNMLESMK